MLSIIIPQYKETFEFMRPLFESLDGQRLIDFAQVEIVIVNDCGEPLHVEQFLEEQIERWNCIVTNIMLALRTHMC